MLKKLRMKDNEIIVSGSTYYLNVDAIMKWCLSSSSNTYKESEINEGYDMNDDGDIQLVSKVIRETKTSNSQDDTIRYDFIKLILNPILNGGIFKETDIQNNFSYKVLINTLIEMKFLIKK